MRPCIVAMLSLTTLIASAQDERFGVGVMIGEPVGLSLKYRLNELNAVDGGVGYSFSGDDNFHLHSDYLWHNYKLLGDAAGHRLPVYYGIGGRIKFGGDLRFGVRGPVGLSYTLPVAPMDVFVEAGPVLDVTPRLRFEFTAAIGARFLF